MTNMERKNRKLDLELLANIHEAIQRCRSNADSNWLVEMLVCCHIAALENPAVQIDDVWEVFERRAAGRETHNKMAAGAVMRQAASLGWIAREQRPVGLMTARNHNSAGTAYWRSCIHIEGLRVPDTFLRFPERRPVQEVLPLCD